MSYTKREYVDMALEEIGLPGYEFDMQPEQLQMAKQRLDAMVATWNGKGIRLGYPIPDSPRSGELSDNANTPDSADEAIYLNLAIRLAPTFGKQVSADTRASAREAYNIVLARAVMPNEMQMPGTMPAGAGHRSIDRNPFVNPPIDPLLAGQDGPLEFN